MLSRLIRMKWPIPVAVLVLVIAVIGVAVVVSSQGSDALVIYNGRSHYGDEDVFEEFTEATGIDVELRGGTAPELFERLDAEGADTPADVLITTDLANLWRADEAGLLADVNTPTLGANVPADLRDESGAWWALTTRLRVPVVATDAIPEGQVTTYEDLADPQYRGRTCLRTSDSEYNQSLVADFLAKRGREETEALLQSWMDNDPQIINSDGEMLQIMADGGCDVGLANHYYLGRVIKDDPDFPVAPAWPDQDGAGAHANVSGVGMVEGTDRPEEAIALMEYLTSPDGQEELAEDSEFPVNPDVPPPDYVRDWADVTIDPINADEAGPLLDEAIALMLEVGWN